MLNNSSLDMLSRILGAENISISVDPSAPTAAFDLKNRRMILPNWSKLSEDVQILLRAHEISHAINTPFSDFHNHVKKEPKAFRSVWNIVEDARIEKLIQRKFPGLRTNFLRGYRELVEEGLFGEISDETISKMNFIDRFNMFFKLGRLFQIEFDDEEEDLLARAVSMETHDDALALARDIYAKMKKDLEQEKNQEKNKEKSKEKDKKSDSDDTDGAPNEEQDESGDGDGDGQPQAGGSDSSEDGDAEGDADGGDSDAGDGNDGELKNDSNTFGRGTSDSDPRLESQTDKKFRQSEQNLASKDKNGSITIKFDKTMVNEINKSIFDSSRHFSTLADGVSQNESEFQRDAMQYVGEFNRRRAAEMNIKTKVEKSGRLNLSKIYSHSFKEDLFLKNELNPKMQNHGLVFYVDFSGSMSTNMNSTLKQLYTLTKFCDIQKIPYDAYGFADGRRYGNRLELDFASVGLFRFASSSFGDRMNKKIRRTFMDSSSKQNSFDASQYFPGGQNVPFSFGGTPLNTAIWSTLHILPKFKRDHRVDIVHCVFLTDGGASDIIGGTNKFDFCEVTDSVNGMSYSMTPGDENRCVSVPPIDMLNRLGMSFTNIFVSNVDTADKVNPHQIAYWAGVDINNKNLMTMITPNLAKFNKRLVFNDTYLMALRGDQRAMARLLINRIAKKMVA